MLGYTLTILPPTRHSAPLHLRPLPPFPSPPPSLQGHFPRLSLSPPSLHSGHNPHLSHYPTPTPTPLKPNCLSGHDPHSSAIPPTSTIAPLGHYPPNLATCGMNDKRCTTVRSPPRGLLVCRSKVQEGMRAIFVKVLMEYHTELPFVDGRVAGHLGDAVGSKTLSIHVCVCPHFGM